MSEAVEIRVRSNLSPLVTGKLLELIKEAFQKGLTSLEEATTTDLEQPHRLEASIEWITFQARTEDILVLGSCTLRVNSILHTKKEEGWISTSGYCESFLLDMSKLPKEEVEDTLHDGVLETLCRVYEVTAKHLP